MVRTTAGPMTSRRVGRIGPRSPATTWVKATIVEAILQVSNSQVHRLVRDGHLRGEKGLVNLQDVLLRYQQLLRMNGAIEEKIEAVSIREFEAGKLPQDVVIEHQFSAEVVLAAWRTWNAMKAEPTVAEQTAAREEARRLDEAARCRDCLRTPSVSKADALRIVKDVTGEDRERFKMTEERAFADLDVRCGRCHQLKATAPVETMRARVRRLNVMGEPKPVELPPLPTASNRDNETANAPGEEREMKTPHP